jgi:hypothetical protein
MSHFWGKGQKNRCSKPNPAAGNLEHS